MVETREIVQRLWSELKFALLARAPDAARQVAAKVAGPDPTLAIEEAALLMTDEETNLPAALRECWASLKPRVGARARRVAEALLAAEPREARWLLAALSEHAGDRLAVSSRLFDHPGAVRRVWLRDPEGPAMYEVRDGGVHRTTPAGVGGVLTEVFGEAAVETLRLVAERPRRPSEVEAEVGADGPRVLEAGHRVLVFRNVAGYFRSRGQAAKLLLTGLGR